MFARRTSRCWCSPSRSNGNLSSAEFRLLILCGRVVVVTRVWRETESPGCSSSWLRRLRSSRSTRSTGSCSETAWSGRSRSGSDPCYASTRFAESRSPTGFVCRRRRCDCASSGSSRRCRRCGQCRSRSRGPGDRSQRAISVSGRRGENSSTSHCRYTSLCHIHWQTRLTRAYCPSPYPVYHFR